MFSHLWCHHESLYPSSNGSNELDEGDGEDEKDEWDPDDADPNDAERADRKCLQAIIKLFENIMVSAAGVVDIVVDAYNSYLQTYYDKEPYHMSVLSGITWVNELLTSHPECV
ncbi:hypothetical protein BDR04DRAFT_1235308 [Suillus decipiens]|nr:hypothetical protein BDR04DRAFT_1235308 [Suillus decipiens]